MIVKGILEEMEKLTAASVGVLMSVFFGEKITYFGGSVVFSPVSFIVELLTKATIAVISGVVTYLAIHYLKKALKHGNDATNS